MSRYWEHYFYFLFIYFSILMGLLHAHLDSSNRLHYYPNQPIPTRAFDEFNDLADLITVNSVEIKTHLQHFINI